MTNPNKDKLTKSEFNQFIKIVSNLILAKFNLKLENTNMYYIEEGVKVKIAYKEAELVKFLGFEKLDKIYSFPRNVYEIYSYIVESKYFNRDLFLYRLMEVTRSIDKDNLKMKRTYFEWHKFIKGLELTKSVMLFTRNTDVILKVIKSNFKKTSKLEEAIKRERNKMAIQPQYKFNMAIASNLIREFKDYDLATKTYILEEFKINIKNRFQLKYEDYLNTFGKTTIQSDFKTFFALDKETLIKNFLSCAI